MVDLIITILIELALISTFIWFSYWTIPIRIVFSICLFVTFLLYIFEEVFIYHHYVTIITYVLWYIVNYIIIKKIRKSYENSTLTLYIWYILSSLVLHCIPYMSLINQVALPIYMITGFASILLFVDWNTLEYRKEIIEHSKEAKEKKLLEVKSSLYDILNHTISKYNIIENIYNTNIKTVSLINLLQNCVGDKNKINNIYISFCQNINIPQHCLDNISIESDTSNKFEYIIKLKSIYIDKINDIKHILSNTDNFEDWEIDDLYNTYCNQYFLNNPYKYNKIKNLK